MSHLIPSPALTLSDSMSQLAPQGAIGDISGEAPQSGVNLLALAWRSRWLLLLLMIVGGAGAWLALQKATPHYTAVSRIYVERSLPQVLMSEHQFNTSVNFLHTQAELIRSTDVLAAVANDPKNASLETFRDVENPVAFLREELQVTVGQTDDIINVWAELPSATDAAQLVNSVVESYISKYAEDRRTNTIEVLKILRNEKARRDKELERCVKDLDEFRRTHEALAVQVGQDSVVTQRFALVADQLAKTEIELLEAKTKYHRVKAMYESPSQRPFLLEIAQAAKSTQRDLHLESQIQTLDQNLVAQRTRWGEGHPQVKLLKESLADLNKKLQKQQDAIVVAYVDELRQAYELQDHKRTELRRDYDTQFKLASEVSSQAIELESLKDALDRAVADCDLINQQVKEVNLTEEVGAMNVTIMETAAPTTEPSYPSQARFLAVGILLGGLCGFGLAWLRDMLDHRLKSVEDIAAAMQLPVLGAVPHMSGSRERSHGGRIVALAPRSAAAEAIRTLRTALHFGLAGNDAKTIAVTSPSAGDGKSTVASNLAIAMAQANQRVLIIDADMRKPRQHEVFEVDVPQGLATILASRQPPATAIIPTEVPALDLLPCGPLPTNPAELLNNGYFSEMLEDLKRQYDKIIIDSPPVMPVADSRVIAAQTDATLLVLRAERSTRRLSIGARNELWKVRAPRLGVVVNGVPTRKTSEYGYGYGYGYGDRHGGGYISEEPLPRERRKKSRALPSPAEQETEDIVMAAKETAAFEDS